MRTLWLASRADGYEFNITILSFSNIDKVDATMASISEQRELANEISEAISNPLYAGVDLDEVRLFSMPTLWCSLADMLSRMSSRTNLLSWNKTNSTNV